MMVNLTVSVTKWTGDAHKQVAVSHDRNEGGGEQSLSKIAIHKATFSLQDSASIKASPLVLGSKGENTRWVNVELEYCNASNEDWVGVFSPVNFK
ncbi:hypothetical protein IFM89_030928 [Coptis chinensis]|uniref:Purple acid phosphatase Fn3-like domain-containing protein n=1 Tax=Coptis chinensis TaxID=261450 RepID=A0A835HR36_9MAGN|nr:hypothetical protein IFM89_030928 [Coptis chinensis]